MQQQFIQNISMNNKKKIFMNNSNISMNTIWFYLLSLLTLLSLECFVDKIYGMMNWFDRNAMMQKQEKGASKLETEFDR